MYRELHLGRLSNIRYCGRLELLQDKSCSIHHYMSKVLQEDKQDNRLDHTRGEPLGDMYRSNLYRGSWGPQQDILDSSLGCMNKEFQEDSLRYTRCLSRWEPQQGSLNNTLADMSKELQRGIQQDSLNYVNKELQMGR